MTSCARWLISKIYFFSSAFIEVCFFDWKFTMLLSKPKPKPHNIIKWCVWDFQFGCVSTSLATLWIKGFFKYQVSTSKVTTSKVTVCVPERVLLGSVLFFWQLKEKRWQEWNISTANISLLDTKLTRIKRSSPLFFQNRKQCRIETL